MRLEEMTARELRSMNPSKQNYYDAVELLVTLGWKFRPERDYRTGWWTHTDHPTKCRPVGDPKNFHFGAWDTLKTYVAPETVL